MLTNARDFSDSKLLLIAGPVRRNITQLLFLHMPAEESAKNAESQSYLVVNMKGECGW